MPIRDKPLRDRYAKSRDYCELIDWEHDCNQWGLQTHHIMRGIWRHDATWNIIRVCSTAHDQLHDVNRMTWEESQVICWRHKLDLGEFDTVEIGKHFRTSVRNHIEESVRKQLIGPRWIVWACELLDQCLENEQCVS
jgi:hypothetical protein